MSGSSRAALTPARADPPRPGGALAYAAGCAVLAGGYAAVFVSAGASARFAVIAAAAVVLPNALLGWVSLHLARRWPWPDPGGAGIARPALAAIGIAIAATAGWLLLAAVDARLTLGTWRLPVRQIVLWQSVMNTVLQGGLLGAGYAWHNGTRAREAQDRARRAEALHARAELQLLRTQLNPHFVLNTLHALLGLVRRDPAKAEHAIERLGELLRFGMSVEQRKVDRVALRDEWAFVTSYLELERFRLGDRLRLDLRADPAAMDLPIPPFAVQPLVENAIVHGVASRGSGGQVRVSVRREGRRLLVEVADDGPGAAEAAILASPRAGLRLLRERLATLYAGDARLAFETTEGGGMRVLLDLPDDGIVEAT